MKESFNAILEMAFDSDPAPPYREWVARCAEAVNHIGVRKRKPWSTTKKTRRLLARRDKLILRGRTEDAARLTQVSKKSARYDRTRSLVKTIESTLYKRKIWTGVKTTFLQTDDVRKIGHAR